MVQGQYVSELIQPVEAYRYSSKGHLPRYGIPNHLKFSYVICQVEAVISLYGLGCRTPFISEILTYCVKYLRLLVAIIIDIVFFYLPGGHLP
jgi:hypothetical protein